MLFAINGQIAKSQGKKSGDFKTVWESEFSNKASRLAMGNEKGNFILGTDDNSATVLNIEAVSYTHLDVYKRQVFVLSLLLFF